MSAELIRPVEKRPRQEKLASVDKRPHHTDHGNLVTPENVTFPDGREALATFNAAFLDIPHKTIPGKRGVVAIWRGQADGHDNGPDKTAYFGMQGVTITENSVHATTPTFIEAATLIAKKNGVVPPENPEDLRLTWNEKKGIVEGSGTQATPDLHPQVVYVAGKPTYDADGNPIGVEFIQSELALQLVDGKPEPIIGKNGQVEWDENGEVLIRYRPEYVDGQLNRNHVRVLRKAANGYWEQYGEDGVYPMQTDALPEGYSIFKYGLNGKGLTSPTGKPFRVDHICMDVPENADGILYEYEFVTVDGKVKKLLTYDEAKGDEKEDDLNNGTKRVIYSNGAVVIPVTMDDGTTKDRFVAALTLFDRKVKVFSWDFDELAAYATEDAGESLSTVPTRRDKPAA